jgi:uracil-DNA glycosylase family 4
LPDPLVDPARDAPRCTDLQGVDALVVDCRACPRLVAWREQVARERRRSFAAQEYCGRAVPGFGPADASILIVGLAPAAHGANRTGRMFTGDRSGDWLYASLFRVGLANQPTSESANDGLALIGTRITAAVHCAPPENKPTTQERDTCAAFLRREVELLSPTLRVAVALGSFGWTAALAALGAAGLPVPSPRPRFGHGSRAQVGDLLVLGSYHPSQQNTFTGRLTEPMLDAVLAEAAAVGRASRLRTPSHGS